MQNVINGSALILTTRQMRMSDAYVIERLGISGEWLMEQAGGAVADAVRFFLEQGEAHEPVLIVAGGGNNGGDGFAAATHLTESGIRVRLASLGSSEKLHGDAAVHAAAAKAAGLEVVELPNKLAWERFDEWVRQSGVVVDALFGTGLNRAPEGDAARLIRAVNGSGLPVLAVDIASGVDGDNGAVPGEAVQARWTLPIAAGKWGHWLGDGRACAGQLLPAADIGINDEVMMAMQAEHAGPFASARLITANDLVLAEADWRYDMHKKDFGHLWVFGGSTGYTGAPRLAAMGAHAMGAGLVSIACPEESYPVIATASLETMVHPQDSAPWQDADAVVAGPGWGREQGGMLARLLEAEQPLLLDADALNMVAEAEVLAGKLKKRTGVTVLTPHPGEAGRLLGYPTGKVQADRPAAARELAERFHAWVVLKGASTLVVSPRADAWLCPFGSTALARGGTGDVLSGMIGALLAQGVGTDQALPAAVGLHALAGEEQEWYLAGELPGLVFRQYSRMRKSV